MKKKKDEMNQPQVEVQTGKPVKSAGKSREPNHSFLLCTCLAVR